MNDEAMLDCLRELFEWSSDYEEIRQLIIIVTTKEGVTIEDLMVSNPDLFAEIYNNAAEMVMLGPPRP